MIDINNLNEVKIMNEIEKRMGKKEEGDDNITIIKVIKEIEEKVNEMKVIIDPFNPDVDDDMTIYNGMRNIMLFQVQLSIFR
jgi:hypothetical protein